MLSTLALALNTLTSDWIALQKKRAPVKQPGDCTCRKENFW
jgi:hypothetical protein